jgi:hypothetical protein
MRLVPNDAGQHFAGLQFPTLVGCLHFASAAEICLQGNLGANRLDVGSQRAVPKGCVDHAAAPA